MHPQNSDVDLAPVRRANYAGHDPARIDKDGANRNGEAGGGYTGVVLIQAAFGSRDLLFRGVR